MSTHNLCVEQKYEKISEFLSKKIGGEIFYIFEQACFRNATIAKVHNPPHTCLGLYLASGFCRFLWLNLININVYTFYQNILYCLFLHFGLSTASVSEKLALASVERIKVK